MIPSNIKLTSKFYLVASIVWAYLGSYIMYENELAWAEFPTFVIIFSIWAILVYTGVMAWNTEQAEKKK